MIDYKLIPTDAIDKVESTRSEVEVLEDEKILVKKGRVDSILIYEVSELELSVLESGSPNSLYLNFFSFLLATFLSFLTTLLTADFSERKVVQIIFIVISIVSGFLTFIFLILWLHGKNQFTEVIKKIKQRMK